MLRNAHTHIIYKIRDNNTRIEITNKLKFIVIRVYKQRVKRLVKCPADTKHVIAIRSSVQLYNLVWISLLAFEYIKKQKKNGNAAFRFLPFVKFFHSADPSTPAIYDRSDEITILLSMTTTLQWRNIILRPVREILYRRSMLQWRYY